MKSERIKIAQGCAIVATAFSIVAYMVLPAYWWFGTIAGLCAGYLGYQFREVLDAIPMALAETGKGISEVWKEMATAVEKWISEPHEVIYPTLILTTPLYVWLSYHFGGFFFGIPYIVPKYISLKIVGVVGLLILHGIVLIEVTVVTMMILGAFYLIGSRIGEKCYCWPFLLCNKPLESQLATASELDAEGYRRETLTYLNFLRWVAKGIGVTIWFFLWTLWWSILKYTFLAIWNIVCFFFRFLYYLVRLIHSNKRLICAIDGTAGAMISHFWFGPHVSGLFGQIAVWVFGVILGMTFGLVNWELISVKWFHFDRPNVKVEW